MALVADEDALLGVFGVDLEVASLDLHRAVALDDVVFLHRMVVLHAGDLGLDSAGLCLLQLDPALVEYYAAAQRGVDAHGVARRVERVVGVAEHAHDAGANLHERCRDGASLFEQLHEQVLELVEYALHLGVGERQPAAGHAGDDLVHLDVAYILRACGAVVGVWGELVVHQYIL